MPDFKAGFPAQVQVVDRDFGIAGNETIVSLQGPIRSYSFG